MTVQADWKDDYLSEMGVNRWYPRVHLINALPTTLREANEPTAVHQGVSNEDNDYSNQLSALAAHEKVSNEVIKETVPKPNQTKGASAQSPNSQVESVKAETVKFGLGVYIIGDYIVASSLVANHAELQDQAWRLLQNILRSIDKTESTLAYHHTIFWPFFQNKNADQSLASAKAYVDDFINHLSEEHKTKKIIALGGVLPKLKGWAPSSDTYKPEEHLVLPSLYKMLQNPSEKAKAWKLIKASPFYNV
ncbi:hypothetical protein KO489_01630 [Reinekea forsetii]|nr:hypothetical protein [Reinekea forsetii]